MKLLKLSIIATLLAGCGAKERGHIEATTTCEVWQSVNLDNGRYEVYTANHPGCRYVFYRFTYCPKNEVDSVKKADYAWGIDVSKQLDSLNPTH